MDRILALLEQSLLATDPTASLETLTELRRELDRFERQQVAKALDAGRSYSAIAATLGISRQAAHRRYRDLPRRAPRIVITPEARDVLGRARDQALWEGAPAIGHGHLRAALLDRGPQRRSAPHGGALPLEAALRAQLLDAGGTIGFEDLRAVAYQSV